ncbi:hypothetical protein KAR91_85715 [Candidatus Pacearchaeota archaeon]|nr:hypothetical protein [Candidatus Pacearchaeota archaeon]
MGDNTMSRGTVKKRIIKKVVDKVVLKKDKTYYHIKSKSKEAIKEFDKQKEKVFRKELKKGSSALSKEVQIREYFIKTGLDYKGQAQTAFHQRGLGVAGSVAFDFGELLVFAEVPPFIELEPGVDLEVRGSYYQFFLLQHQIEHIMSRKNPYPLCLAKMEGGHIGGTFKVGLNASLKVPDFDVGVLDMIQFGYEVKLGGEANISISGDFYIALDRQPYWIVKRNRSEIQKLLLRALKGKETSGIGQMDWGGVNPYQKKSSASVSAKNKYCRLMYATCKPEAGGGLQFKAGVKAGIGGISTGVKGPELNGELKFEWYRMDVPCYNGYVMSQDTQVTFKQLKGQAGLSLELGITSGLGLKVGNKPGEDEDDNRTDIESSGLLGWAKLVCPEKFLSQGEKFKDKLDDGIENAFNRCIGEGNMKKAKAVVDKVKGFADLIKGEFTFNSMEYNSNILVWKPAGQDGKFDSHPGSGYIRGVSVSAFSFASYYLNEVFVKQSKREKGLLDKKVKKAREGALSFVKGLSRKLRVSWKDMRAFLMDPSNAGLIQDLCRAGYKAFLLETTFGIPPVKKIIPTEKKSKIFPAYRGVFKKKLSNYNSKKPNPNLQSIRLRFRINDHAESNSSFKLGINIWAPKVGIELKGFDRVGSEGIIDLATQWYGAFSSFNLTKSEAAYQSDRSVVPAVLL